LKRTTGVVIVRALKISPEPVVIRYSKCPTSRPMSSAGEIPFRFLLRVRYGEVDAQKIVFNARWGDWR